MSHQDMKNAHPETGILILLTPDPRRRVHERCEGAIGPAERPNTRKAFGVGAGALADQPYRAADISGFLNCRLDAGAQRIGLRIIMTPKTAMFDIYGFRKIGREGNEAVIGDIVHPFD